jgi:hypothetical protein
VAKVKKPIDKKHISIEAQALLRDCTADQLAFLSDISSNKNFEAFLGVIRNMIDRNMAAVFTYSEADPQKLTVFKANARGQVGALTLLAHAMKGAEAEKDRREKGVK